MQITNNYKVLYNYNMVPTVVRALYDFHAERDNELSFSAGDQLVLSLYSYTVQNNSTFWSVYMYLVSMVVMSKS